MLECECDGRDGGPLWVTEIGRERPLKKVFFVFHIDVPRRGKAIICKIRRVNEQKIEGRRAEALLYFRKLISEDQTLIKFYMNI